MLKINFKPEVKEYSYSLFQELKFIKKVGKKYLLTFLNEKDFNKFVTHLQSNDPERGYYYVVDDGTQIPIIGAMVSLKDGCVYGTAITPKEEKKGEMPF